MNELRLTAPLVNRRRLSGTSKVATIEEHADALKRLATYALVPDSVLSLALSHVEDRLSEVTAASAESSYPDIFKARAPDNDAFSDVAPNNLFASLR